jgi:hypothetical protein
MLVCTHMRDQYMTRSLVYFILSLHKVMSNLYTSHTVLPFTIMYAVHRDFFLFVNYV